jgi:hypothetical protein
MTIDPRERIELVVRRSPAPAVVRPTDGLSDQRVVGVHAAILGSLTAVVAIAPQLLRHPNAPARVRVLGDPVLGGWVRWDGWWYIAIARHGYTYQPHHMSSVAFFPVYPLVVRFLTWWTPGQQPFAAVAVTATCGAIAFVLFHRWCRRRMAAHASAAALGVLAIYPFAWFLYGAAYSDALYLVLVLAAFLLLENDKTVGSGIVGAVATATRPTGITLVVGLVAVAADRSRTDQRSRARRVGGVLLSLLGLLAWCAWLGIRFGNPLAFIETEGAPGWNQPAGFHTWLKLDLFHRLSSLPWPEAAEITLQIGIAVAFVAAVGLVHRRLGTGYAIYTAAVIAFPVTSSADFLGVGRYLLPAFPVFALAGAASTRANPAVVRTAALVSAALLVTGAALFSTGYLVA